MLRSLITASVAALTITPIFADDPAPPNLVVIMTDDQGYGDVGFNGCKDIPTPHIDSIAKDGVRFTDGYACYSYCSPSRAGFLTGRYPQRFGHERNPAWNPTDRFSGLPLTEKTLATALGAVGYHSGIIGKWHLGCHELLHPLERGFNEFYGHLGGGHFYFPDDLTIKDTEDATTEAESYRLQILRNRIPEVTGKYLTDEFSDEAVEFIGKNRSKPFFLYLAYNAPHAPMQAPDQYLERFPDISDKKRKTYAAMVSAVDDGVGRVLVALKKHGLEENTLVVFMSDNGGPEEQNASSNGPLRGGKGDPWEGGIRVPFAMRWPKQIPKGLEYNHPVLSLDVFATMAAAANLKEDPQRPLDGVDLIRFFKGSKYKKPHKAIYLRMSDKGAYVVRADDFKLVIDSKDAKPTLHELRRDIGEERDFYSVFPEKVATLEQMRKEWASHLIPPAFKGRETK